MKKNYNIMLHNMYIISTGKSADLIGKNRKNKVLKLPYYIKFYIVYKYKTTCHINMKLVSLYLY